MTRTTHPGRRRVPPDVPSTTSAEAAPSVTPVAPAARIASLQRTAGNRATARLLAPAAPTRTAEEAEAPHRTGAPAPITLQRDPKAPAPPAAFVGDPKKAEDAKYAGTLGKDDAARLQGAGTLSDGDKTEIKAKLAFFKGKARDVYLRTLMPVLAELALSAQSVDRAQAGKADYVGTLLDVIQKLKAERINSWKLIADVEQTEVAMDLLHAVVASVALGIGGIVGDLASASLQKGLYKIFVDLSALEAGDIAVEAAFKAGVATTATALTMGTRDGVVFAEQNCKTALSSKNQPSESGKFNVFAEAMRLQTISEQLTTAKAFQTGASTTYDSVSLAGKVMSLEAVHKELAARPEIIQRTLTEGFMRLLAAVRATSSRPNELGPQQGRIFLLPDIGARNRLGEWSAPGIESFTHFNGSTRGLNAATLMSLDNAKIEDLKVDLEFAVDVTNAYSGWFQSPFSRIWIDRDASGGVTLRNADDDTKEWLGSYYSRISRELTSTERDVYAPLGAIKLYQAIKGKQIHRPKNADKLVPD
ncbi:hypothetical protein [Cellulomonas sp.]|uniref:hypothetical protein n=1 Tax=Cellulomonas sp. TaxID=40001 RepID=UPI003BAB16BC